MGRNCCQQKKPFLNRLYQYIIIIIAVLLIGRFLYEHSSLFYRKSVVLPFSLHLNKKDIYMIKGEETRLFVYGINKRVSFSSTNFRVAGVNFNGRVYAYQTGKAFIIAKVDGKQLKCRVHVIDMNKDNLSLKVGETYRLRVKGATSYIRWKSNHNTVASVSMFGKVKAHRKGTAVITAKVKGRTIRCSVQVK